MDVIEGRPLPMPAGTPRPVTQGAVTPVAHGGPPADDPAPLNQNIAPTNGGPFDPGAPSTGPPLDQRDYWYELVDQRVAAAFLGVKPRTIADWRHRGVGPNWVSISLICKRYRRIDLAAFVEQKMRSADAA